jgi:protein TonB
MAQFIKADLDEMVFEDRERGYGAYFLRKKYVWHLLIGTVLMCVTMLLLSFLPNMVEFKKEKEEVRTVKAEINLADLPPPPPIEEEKAPPPPPKVDVPPPKLKTVAFKIPEPKPKEEIVEEEEIVEMDSLEDAPNIGLEDVEGSDEGFIDIPEEGDGEVPVVVAEPEPSPDEFIFVSEEPQPLNMDDVRKIIGYPEIARDAGIEGQVVVRVLVDEKGNYRKHKMIKKVHPILAEAVESNLKQLKFSPAIQGNKPIKFWVNIPFRFKLMN